MRLSFKYIPMLFLLASCELAVDVDVPYGKDKIVVNSVQSIDSVWTVDITKSNYILSREYWFSPLDFAKVTITKPDGSTEQLQLTSVGRYAGTTHPVTGQTYKITATANGFDTTEGQMTMPTVVPIIDIEFDSSGVQAPSQSGNQSVGLNFKLTFRDPPGEKNFYAVEVYRTAVYERLNVETGERFTDTAYQEVPVRITDAAIASENDNRQWFTDNTFEGKTYTAPMYTSWYSFDDYQVIGFDIRFISMSEEYYKYLSTERLSFNVGGDPFAQPVPVFSNLSNGFGIFAGASYQLRRYWRH